MFCFCQECPNFKWYLNNYNSCLYSVMLPQYTYQNKPLVFGKNQFEKGNSISHIEHTSNFLLKTKGTYEITLKIAPLLPDKQTNKCLFALALNNKIKQNSELNFNLSKDVITNEISCQYKIEIQEETTLSILFSENNKLNLSHIIITKISS